MDPSAPLERMLTLLLEYPMTGLVAAVVSLNQGFFISEATTVALCLCLLALLYCVHLYDLARQRVQEVARSVDAGIEIRRNFCFASTETQESFERWRHRAMFWRALDWGAVAHNGVFTLKLAWRRECGTSFQIVPLLAVFSLLLGRMTFREKLSSAAYSLLSLFANTLVWATHCGFLLAGDPCFGAVGREGFADSIQMQALFACAALVITNLITPVCQAFVPLKLSIAFAGSLASSYMHMLFRDGGLNVEVDREGWGYFWLCLGLCICTMATFHANTMLVETGMTRFLTTVVAHRD
jgi:hypothetical protein